MSIIAGIKELLRGSPSEEHLGLVTLTIDEFVKITMGMVTVYTAIRFLKFCINVCYYGHDLPKKYPQTISTVVVPSLANPDVGIAMLKKSMPVEFNVAGLDCEMKSDSTQSGHPVPALLQLAKPTGFCCIFQISHLKDESFVWNFLRDKNPPILLVGIGVMEDMSYLKQCYPLDSYRCLDIRHVAKKMGYPPAGLEVLALHVLGEKLKKNIKAGPWEAYYLTEKQINYAARDARLCVNIFMKLNQIELSNRHNHKKMWLWDEKTYWKHTLKLWEHYINKPFISSVTMDNDILRNDIPVEEDISGCVVCGSNKNIGLKPIVPVDYNIISISDQPHYLNLCKQCIDKCLIEDRSLREYLRHKCGAPHPNYDDEKLQIVKKIAKEILLRQDDFYENLEAHKEFLCNKLSLRKRKLTLQHVKVISIMDCWPGSSHGEQVLMYYRDYYKEEDLRRLWCDNLMKTMEPEYLPYSWRKFYTYYSWES